MRRVDGAVTQVIDMRSIMGVIISVFITFLINPAISAEIKSDDSPGSLSLILARPFVTREVGPVVSDDGDYSFSAVFEVKLTKVALIFGDMEKNDITVNLTANHREVFRKTKAIHVLLETKNGVTQAVYWGHPYLVACVPITAIEGRSESSMFYLSEQQNNRERRRVCIDAERNE